tara:strand:- start:2379 stop:2558 length:180 start_codon:yes stop_codon:yes gene_type:complete
MNRKIKKINNLIRILSNISYFCSLCLAIKYIFSDILAVVTVWANASIFVLTWVYLNKKE